MHQDTLYLHATWHPHWLQLSLADKIARAMIGDEELYGEAKNEFL